MDIKVKRISDGRIFDAKLVDRFIDIGLPYAKEEPKKVKVAPAIYIEELKETFHPSWRNKNIWGNIVEEDKYFERVKE